MLYKHCAVGFLFGVDSKEKFGRWHSKFACFVFVSSDNGILLHMNESNASAAALVEAFGMRG